MGRFFDKMKFNFLSGSKNHGGGAQSIQVLLIEELSNKGINSRLFDVKDGSVYVELKSRGVEFEYIILEDFTDYSDMLCNDDILVVFNTNFFGNLLRFGKSNCKVIVWEIFFPWVFRFVNYRYIPFKPLISYYEKIIIDEIVSNKAFFFIDNLGKEAVEKKINKPISDDFLLPIPVKFNYQVKLLNEKRSNKIKISYVGRSVEWKIYPFIKILEDSISYFGEKTFSFHVVCDDVNYFKKIISKNGLSLENVEIEFHENISMDNLIKLLMECDLHFAMGTSALDGAKLGIPTVVMDFMSDRFTQNYSYRWLFESKRINLGKNITKEELHFDGIHTFNEIISGLVNKNDLGIKCRNYAEQIYNVDFIIQKLINYDSYAAFNLKNIRNMYLTRYILKLKRLGI